MHLKSGIVKTLALFVLSATLVSATYNSPPIASKQLALPCIEFEENGLAMLSCNEVHPDSTIAFLSFFLHKNTLAYITVTGHADSVENQPDSIALQRANFVKQTLVDKGMSATRINTISLGCQQPILQEAFIKAKLNTLEERNAARQKNRRIVVTIYKR